MDSIFENLNNIITILLVVIMPFAGKYIRKAFNVVKEIGDLINAIADAGKPEPDGSIKFTSEEWLKIQKEARDIKALFKKKKNPFKSIKKFWILWKLFGKIKEVIRDPKKLKSKKFILTLLGLIVGAAVAIGLLEPELADSIKQIIESMLSNL